MRDSICLVLPPIREIAGGRIVKYNLADADFEEMEPVISLAG